MVSPHLHHAEPLIYRMAMLMAPESPTGLYSTVPMRLVTEPHKKEDGEQPVEPDTPEPAPGSPT